MNASRDWTNGEKRLIVRRCDDCAMSTYLPAAACPYCGSTGSTEYSPSGRGVLAAVTVLRRRSDGGPPIGIALVDLEEGVRVMSRCDVGVAIGAAVVVGIEEVDDGGGPAKLLPVARS